MRFDIITIFPEMIESYLGESILKRARAKKLVEFRVHNLRQFSRDKKHEKIDDRPYGGGPGMVLQIEPLVQVLSSVIPANPIRNFISNGANAGIQKSKSKIILFSGVGKQFNAKMAADLAKKYDQVIMIAGRYEGVDARIKKLYKMEEVSVGPYVLTGGELPALVVIDAVSRHIPEFLEKMNHSKKNVMAWVYQSTPAQKFSSGRKKNIACRRNCFQETIKK